ncbi:MFS transporter [Candidatus Sumerlaeota bacterium]|nr:MFS transporter [Candidatus Sumerlaeota bacterium]
MLTPSASQPPSRLRRDLRAITGDGVAYSVMVGSGEAYLAAFVLALGFSDVMAGLMSTIPLLAGAVLQTISPRAVRLLRSNKRWVVACVATQTLSFVPLIIAALVGAIPAWALFGVAALYWGSGMGAGPAWNTWAGQLIPVRLRASYLGQRARLIQIGVVAGLLIGGGLLELGTALSRPLDMFALIFLVAGISRLISTRFLLGQSEAPSATANHRQVPVRELLGRFRHGEDARLLLYLVLVQVAVQIAGPFFTPLMLGPMGFSYGEYLAVIAAAFVSKVLFFPMLGRLARRHGARSLLIAGGMGIVPLSALWLLSDSVYFLIGLQVFSGIAWATLELASMLLFFETIHEDERTSLLTLFNLANCTAIVIGSLIGGAVLHGFGEGLTGYVAVLALSAVARALTIPLLLRIHGEVSVPRRLALRLLGVRPSAGAIIRPEIASLPTLEEEAEPPQCS